MAETARTSDKASLMKRLLNPSNRLTWIAAAIMLTIVVLWLSFTPAGLLGKADAIGYAVCHRIVVRSFLFPGGRALPLCARCSGTFLGVLVGLLGPGLVLKRKRAGLFPPLGIMLIMLGASALWAFDGTNSFLHLLPAGRVPRLYEPTNFLRLLTGTLHGITMGNLLLPIANATLWANVAHQRTIEKLWHLLILWGIGGLLIAMMLSGLGIFLYPLAILSALGVAAVLTVINTIMVATVLRKENRASSMREVLPLIFLGIAVTFAMIGIIDLGRFALFGSWDGFVYSNV